MQGPRAVRHAGAHELGADQHRDAGSQSCAQREAGAGRGQPAAAEGNDLCLLRHFTPTQPSPLKGEGV